MSKQSVDDRLQAMRDDLVKLVAALNQDGQLIGARRVQSIAIAVEHLTQPGQLEATDRWMWPPRFDKQGEYVLVEGK
jgi:hypothetical protein